MLVEVDDVDRADQVGGVLHRLVVLSDKPHGDEGQTAARKRNEDDDEEDSTRRLLSRVRLPS